MKKMIFLCLFPSLGMAQIVNPPITRADKELKGEVKTMVERTYDVYRGDLKQKRLATENRYVFDKAGYATDSEQRYSGNSLRYQYVYDATQHPLEVTITKTAHGGSLISTGKYEYDAQGKLLSYRMLMQGSASPTQVYTFSKWDNNGNPVEGLLQTDKEKAKVWQEFNKYNQRTLLKMVTEGDTSSEIRIEVRYDREGRVVERSIAEGNTPPQVLRYTYDKKGIPTGTNNQQFKHTFDKKGNWITRTIFVNGAIVGYVEREITN